MKRIIAILAVLALVMSFAACGDNKPASGGSGQSGNNTSSEAAVVSTNDNTQSGEKSLADIYEYYDSIIDLLQKKIGDIIEVNNKKLQDAGGEYYNDPAYMIVSYLPFLTLSTDPIMFSAGTPVSTLELSYSYMGHEDAKIEQDGNQYTVTYKDSDSDGEYVNKKVMKFDPQTISMSYVSYRNDEVVNFYEYVGLGNDKYALVDTRDRAIVTCKDGEILTALHASNIYDEDWETGELSKESAVNVYPDDSIFGKTVDDSWVTQHEADGAIERLYNFDGSTLKITGMKTDYDWESGETTYTPGFSAEIKVEE